MSATRPLTSNLLGYLYVLGVPADLDQLSPAEHATAQDSVMGSLMFVQEQLEALARGDSPAAARSLLTLIQERERLNGRNPADTRGLEALTLEASAAVLRFYKALAGASS